MAVNKDPGAAALGFSFAGIILPALLYTNKIFYRIIIASPKEKNLYFSCTATS